MPYLLFSKRRQILNCRLLQIVVGALSSLIFYQDVKDKAETVNVNEPSFSREMLYISFHKQKVTCLDISTLKLLT